MMETSLSVCIPTFNRARELDLCLMALVEQCRPFGVEICVSDNGSSDGTPAVIERWRQVYPLLRYDRLPTNQRIDRNIVNAAKLATGSVIWLFSDDDIPEPGAIEYVLGFLRRYPKTPAFIVNRTEFDSQLSEKLHFKPLFASSDEEKTFSADEALSSFGDYLGYLPAWIVRRADWARVNPEPFLDTDFVHIGIGISAVAAAERAEMVFSNRSVVRCRLARASWRNRHYEVWIRNWQKTMRGLEKAASAEARETITRQLVQKNLICLLSGRAMNGYGWTDYRRHIAPFIGSPTQHFVALACALIPRKMASVLTQAQRTLRERLG